MAGEIAEKFVEEWLNRQGFFTIRQVTVAQNKDMDILACRIHKGKLDCRHYEVQAADTPIGFIVNGGKLGKRNLKLMEDMINQWMNKKFKNQKTADMRKKIVDDKWTYHFVVHKVKHEQELGLLQKRKDLTVHRLSEIREDLSNQKFLGFKAGERQLVNLVLMGP